MPEDFDRQSVARQRIANNRLVEFVPSRGERYQLPGEPGRRVGACQSRVVRAKTSDERLPPRGLGAEIPLWRQDCNHLTAKLALISKRSAASRREAPSSTASITRSRKSPE
jgi:hypothetical protein